MPPKRFKYRLEKILEFKRKAEEDEKQKLAKLRQEKAHEEQVKIQIENQLAQVHIDLKTKRLSGQLNMAELRWFPQHIKNLEGKIKYQELRIRELEIKIEEQIQNLAKAMQERKTYEKHKENCHEEFIKEEDAIESRLLDELATIKFARDLSKRVDE